MTSFNERFSALIQREVAKAVAEVVGEFLSDTGTTNAPEGTQRAAAAEIDAEDAAEGKRRSKKRGRGRASKVYALKPHKGRRTTPKLHRTAQMVWEFIKENGPSTAADIETGTELGKKTVESSVWFLRNSGHVVSKPIAD